MATAGMASNPHCITKEFNRVKILIPNELLNSSELSKVLISPCKEDVHLTSVVGRNTDFLYGLPFSASRGYTGARLEWRGIKVAQA